ncbi:MAG: hypothetical protein ACKVXR_15825 [Planctomycetota bacterium]
MMSGRSIPPGTSIVEPPNALRSRSHVMREQPILRRAPHVISIMRLFLMLILLQSQAQAQLAEWSRGFENPGVDGVVYSMAEFDDGTGMALYVGGVFETAGTIPAKNIARWDGHAWSAVGPGVEGVVTAMTVFDDGSGAQLYAAGFFPVPTYPYHTYLGRWNGVTWSPLPNTDGEIDAMAVFDDGSGPALYVGGEFVTPGLQGAINIARLNGASWAPLGAGLGGTSSGDRVRTLIAHDDGAGGGLALYAGGQFSVSGSTAIQGLARWDGASWSAVGPGLDPPSATVFSLAEFSDGSGVGPALYAGGSIYSVGGVALHSLIRWDGANWSAPGGGVVGTVRSIEVFDDGSSAPALFVGGNLYQAGGQPANTVARWDGSTWSVSGWEIDFSEKIHVLAGCTVGGVARLFAAGYFISAEEVNADCIAQLVNGKWIGLGRAKGMNSKVSALCVREEGGRHGQQLFAAGQFTIAGTTAAEGVARWDGSTWYPLGEGIDVSSFSSYDVKALANFDDGTGNNLFATGYFAFAGGSLALHIASWDGASWSPLGTGLNPGHGRALAVWNDGAGRDLYVGGDFITAGSVTVNNIARWDGAAWSALAGGVNGAVNALLAHESSSGSALYAAGVFTTAGAVPVVNVAKWDGANWTAMGNPGVAVNSLAMFDDGIEGDPALFAAGVALTGVGANVARWNGTTWTPVGFNVPFESATVFKIFVHDDGTGGGPALYAGGLFDRAGTTSAHYLARWNGQWWQEVAGNLDGPVHAMAELRGAGGGQDLIVGGYFETAGGKPSKHVARLSKDAVLGKGYCYGDGLDPSVSIPCPCLNQGLALHGCANSNFQGSRLGASGKIPGDITLTATNVPHALFAILLSASSSVPSGVPFGDGIRCIAGRTRRAGIQFPTRGTVTFRVAPGVPGSVTHYELLYRAVMPNHCPPALFNVSNAVEISW